MKGSGSGRTARSIAESPPESGGDSDAENRDTLSRRPGFGPGGRQRGPPRDGSIPTFGRILEDHAQVLATTGHKAEPRAANERAREVKSAFGWQANTGSGTVDWRDLR